MKQLSKKNLDKSFEQFKKTDDFKSISTGALGSDVGFSMRGNVGKGLAQDKSKLIPKIQELQKQNKQTVKHYDVLNRYKLIELQKMFTELSNQQI